jgi:hypothetical protein
MAGRPGLDFYELRHCAATMLLERGMTPWDVAIQLGHQDGGRLGTSLYVAPLRSRGPRAAASRLTLRSTPLRVLGSLSDVDAVASEKVALEVRELHSATVSVRSSSSAADTRPAS